jgi:hypothetical protein
MGNVSSSSRVDDIEVSEPDKNRGMLDELASVLGDAFIVYVKCSGTFSTLNVPRNQGVTPKLNTESFASNQMGRPSSAKERQPTI